MPNAFERDAVDPSREIRLTRGAVIALATVLTFVAGTLFSSAAMAAGIDSPDVLALVFALGGCTMLFLLLVWYIVQLARVGDERHVPPAMERRFIHRGAPWTQPRRPPSGSTIMWALGALRRRTTVR
jgi:hypothetical protein